MEPHDQHRKGTVAVLQPGTALAVAMPQAGELVDCWNQIGVAGDGSCVELSKVVHCRNCQVYAAAGARLLDRALPQNYRRDWSEHFAHEKKRVSPGWNSAVIFRLGVEWFALPTLTFQEVAELRPIHSLPHRQNALMLGLINVRGELLICVSLARMLRIKDGGETGLPRAQQRLVVTEWQGSLLAFPVDEIQGIQRYHPDELKPAPAMAAQSDSNYAIGLLPWRDKLVGCLDADLVFSTLNRNLS